MKLSDLGYREHLSDLITSEELSGFTVGRVTQEHRERYIVSDGEHEYEAEITGNLRYTASSREDFPAVGDWVAMTVYDSGQAIIQKILPRKSLLARQAVGKPGEKQVISANIDCAFVVQAINNNFNINRLERYLTICYSAGIEPVLVLSKTDLVSEEVIKEATGLLEARDRRVKYILVSNITGEGLDKVIDFIQRGMTCCVMGSSGVGKSTLINTLLKREALRTGEISSSTDKGKHITEHRELFVMDNGGIIIDTPGMRELGLTDDLTGINTTFREINDLAQKCRYPDCTHVSESGCAVLEAVENGTLDRGYYDNYIKMLKEQERFTTSVAEKHRREKQFGKLMKNYHRDMKDHGLE
jgi:ribosome biogenesis GTPase